MGLDDVPLDDKAKRTRDLLSSFYALGPSMSSSRATSLDAINTNSFDADQYMNLLAYGDSSFKDCKRASEEAVTVIIKNLRGKLFSDSESIQARAEAAVVLKQLDFPVESLQAKLLEKLEQSVLDLHFKMEDLKNASIDYGDPSREGNMSESPPANVHEVSVREFVEAIRAYRVIFSDSDEQLIKLARGFITKHFETTDEYQKNRLSSVDLLCVLRIIWKDVLLMDKVFPEGALPDSCLEASQVSLEQHLSSTFSQLLHDISDALTKTHIKQEGERDNSLQMGLEASKKAVLQGSVDVLLVIVAASERCLDPVPLEPPILDKLVQAKLAKTKGHNSTSS